MKIYIFRSGIFDLQVSLFFNSFEFFLFNSILELAEKERASFDPCHCHQEGNSVVHLEAPLNAPLSFTKKFQRTFYPLSLLLLLPLSYFILKV